MIRHGDCPRCRTELSLDTEGEPRCPGCGIEVFYQDAVGFRGWLPRDCGGRRLLELTAASERGLVFKAQHRQSEALFAVKVLQPSAAGESRDDQRLADLLRPLKEVTHRNLVTPLDHGSEGRVSWVVMPWVEGPALTDLLADARRRGRPVSLNDTRRLLVQVAEALQQLHRHQLVHGNLKPNNILITFDGTVKVVDAGIPVSSSDPEYAAPEQASGRGLTPASDVYSVGVIWYELLTGDLPGSSARTAIALRSDCPEAWSDLIGRSLAVDPAARPRLDAISAALRADQPVPPSAEAEPKPMVPIEVPPWLPGTVGGLIVGTIAGAGVAMYMGGGYLICCLIGAGIGALVGALVRGS